MTDKPRIRITSPNSLLNPLPGIATADSYANFTSRTGFGTQNQSSAGGYTFDLITRQRVQLEAMYRSSWIVGAIVDTVSEDMTKAGAKLTGGIDPHDTGLMKQAGEAMCLWPQLCEGQKWGRLYGGGVGVLMIDGQDMKSELDIGTVGKGQFKGVYPMDRWLVQPSFTELVTDLGPRLGEPKYYNIVADGLALKRQTIHYSRILRFRGVPLPYWQRQWEQGWDMSVVERLFDRLLAFDSCTAGTAQLVFRAHLRTMSIKGLRDIISGVNGPDAVAGLVAQMNFVRQYQSNEGLTMLDADDTFEAHQFTFAGLDDVLLMMGQQLSGASQIPLVRLFGQSPKGMNATGESDMDQYYEGINQKQESHLRPNADTVLKLTARSTLGGFPEDFGFEFNPLAKLTAPEKAEIFTKVTTAVLDLRESNLIPDRTALQEIAQQSDETGFGTNITNEMIEAASDEIPDPMEELPIKIEGDPNAVKRGEAEEQKEKQQPVADFAARALALRKV